MDLDKLESRAIDNTVELNQDKRQVPYTQRGGNLPKSSKEDNWLGSSTAEKDVGVLTDLRLHVRHQCDAVAFGSQLLFCLH